MQDLDNGDKVVKLLLKTETELHRWVIYKIFGGGDE